MDLRNELFNNVDRLGRLVRGLPIAFEMASSEVPKQNPAIGILREHVLAGFFVHEFGQHNVKFPKDGINRSYDISIYGKPLSIKTITGNGDVKVLWTVDTKIVNEEIKAYTPEIDIFLVSINWNKNCESIYYIPLCVQLTVQKMLGPQYLNAAVGTNHRGISISKTAMKLIKENENVSKTSVNWVKVGVNYAPHDRWMDFWSTL